MIQPRSRFCKLTPVVPKHKQAEYRTIDEAEQLQIGQLHSMVNVYLPGPADLERSVGQDVSHSRRLVGLPNTPAELPR
jgi:hypothetical protein